MSENNISNNSEENKAFISKLIPNRNIGTTPTTDLHLITEEEDTDLDKNTLVGDTPRNLKPIIKMSESMLNKDIKEIKKLKEEVDSLKNQLNYIKNEKIDMKQLKELYDKSTTEINKLLNDNYSTTNNLCRNCSNSNENTSYNNKNSIDELTKKINDIIELLTNQSENLDTIVPNELIKHILKVIIISY